MGRRRKGGSISGGFGESTGGGGGGGAYSIKANIAVIPGNNYTVVVGAGSSSTAAGGDSYFIDTSTVLAKGGNSATSPTGASGGLNTSGVGDTRYSGGGGASGSDAGNRGGGGGSSAGTGANGTTATTGAGAIAPTGGGNGGNAASGSSGNGATGIAPGGGGGGAYRAGGGGSWTGGSGAAGKVVITYKYNTTTTVSCTPNPVTYGSGASCTATVTRSGGSSTPSGTVTWTHTDTGAFSNSTCTLSGSGGTATCSVTYTPGAVGDGVHGITAAYGGDANFNGSSNSTPYDVTVNRKAASVTPAAASKSYGEADPTLTGTLSGFLAGDNVTATYSRTAGETVAGSPYTISAELSPAGVLGNYDITYNTANFTINRKELTVTGITANNKPYDGNTTATLNTGSAGLVGVVDDDDVTLDTSGAAGAFASPNVGTWTVTISGLTLDGADAGNYTLTQPTTTASITGATVTVSGITAEDKVYDGTTDATLDTTLAALEGVVSGDDVTLDTSGAVGAFSDANVGAGKIVAISGLTLDGADAGKYLLVQPTTTAAIFTRPITVTANSGQSKVYGAADPVFTYTNDPLVGGDTFTGALSRVAGETVAGSPYAITQGDLSAGSNYSITFVSADFNITPASTTISLASSANPSVVGATVTFTATVAPPAATGSVQFFVDGVALGSPATLSGGTASVSTATLAEGTHNITATYSGDGNFNGSATSEPLLQEVAALAEPSYDIYLPVIFR